jgi:transketolase
MEMSGGSLGHGLTIAVGRCLGLKRKGSDAFVYTLFSDGELDEGAIWEGLMSAAHWKLDNLIAMVDVNNQQADGPSSQIMAFEPLVEKLEAFGWFTQRVDGNDIDAVKAAFDAARNHPKARPRIIVCDTRMGCGVPFLEEREKNHFIRVDAHEGNWRLRHSKPGGKHEQYQYPHREAAPEDLGDDRLYRERRTGHALRAVRSCADPTRSRKEERDRHDR